MASHNLKKHLRDMILHLDTAHDNHLYLQNKRKYMMKY